MKSILKTSLIVILSTSLFTQTFADQSQMDQTLVQVVQQLQQLKPLIAEAAAEEPADMRASVHFSSFTGPDGQTQSGVMDDLTALQSGIEQIINQQQIDPRIYTPISGDYVGSK